MDDVLPTGAVESDEPLDPVRGLAMIDAQRRAMADARGDSRLLYGAWAVAWFVGFGLLWLTADAHGVPAGWAYGVYCVCLAAALVVTVVTVSVQARGFTGPSRTAGQVYGWSWFAGFVAVGLITGALGRAGASEEVLTIAPVVMSCLVVGLLYLSGWALWRNRTMGVLGILVLAIGALAGNLGLPGMFAAMALLGGVCFGAGAVLREVAIVRERRTVRR